MTKIIEKAHTDLISLDAEAEMCNAPTIVAIERKMAPNMRQDWAEKVGGKALSSRQKFMMMMEFINKWRNKLEYLEDISNVAPEVKGMSCHTNEETSDQRNTKRENRHFLNINPRTSTGGCFDLTLFLCAQKSPKGFFLNDEIFSS